MNRLNQEKAEDAFQQFLMEMDGRGLIKNEKTE
ncbi:hypothetical protein AQB9606_01895 [Aquabacterium sp. CECT 9606]|nr:hypothetical protein AQB9606_01895 [Aquabacterium sp. CECT 9606]